MSEPLLSLRDVRKDFRSGRRVVSAVRGVSFDVASGESFGIVGESGCGKTTLARLMLRLDEPSAGSIRFDGEEIAHHGEREMRPLRRHVQIVFQDPYSSLNPRMRVGAIVEEPLRAFGVPAAERRERVAEALRIVGLSEDSAARFPHAFSGGQRQRVGIARALVVRPKLLVCDEAVSALDVSVQAQILSLLEEVRRRFALSLVFISHNLAVVRHLCERVAVMYEGQVVELASRDEVFERPRHPYTRALLASVLEPVYPQPEARRAPLPGERDGDGDGGCSFRARCPEAAEACSDEPALERVAPDVWARCHFASEDVAPPEQRG